MEMMVTFLTSKLFIAFVTLAVVYNMVRRYNKQVRQRSTRTVSRLRERIRSRQMDRWNGNGPDSEKDE